MCSLSPNAWPIEVLAHPFRVLLGTEWLVQPNPRWHSLTPWVPGVHPVLVEAQSLCAMALAIHLFLTGHPFEPSQHPVFHAASSAGWWRSKHTAAALAFSL